MVGGCEYQESEHVPLKGLGDVDKKMGLGLIWVMARLKAAYWVMKWSVFSIQWMIYGM